MVSFLWLLAIVAVLAIVVFLVRRWRSVLINSADEVFRAGSFGGNESEHNAPVRGPSGLPSSDISIALAVHVDEEAADPRFPSRVRHSFAPVRGRAWADDPEADDMQQPLASASDEPDYAGNPPPGFPGYVPFRGAEDPQSDIPVGSAATPTWEDACFPRE